MIEDLKAFLDQKVDQYNTDDFIASDPISIPKQFTEVEDIEISAFLAATISWGQRKAILKSGDKIMQILEYQPYNFVLNGDIDSIPDGAVYRTFNGSDLRYMLNGLRIVYKEMGGLHQLFVNGYNIDKSIKQSLIYFREQFTKYAEPGHCAKHIANAKAGSSSKRLNMFLRWMVRKDKLGVDFGLWNDIDTASLMLPLDVHTGNVGRKLGLLTRKANDWKAVEEITDNLRKLDSNDPVKYDYALFSLGVVEKF